MPSFMISDLQWGSTGKGAISYYLAKRHSLRVAVNANMPNAGHTARDGKRKWVHTVLPSAIAADSCEFALIGPGSVFDSSALIQEVLTGDLIGKTIIIHPAAVPLFEGDHKNEAGLVRIGSTMKGSAAANMRRMGREGHVIAGQPWFGTELVRIRDAVYSNRVSVYVDASYYHEALLRHRGSLIVEGAQGFGLSIYHGFYPHVTSRDCTPNQLASDCALPSDWRRWVQVVGVLRTLPIRVANRYDADGHEIGSSGPCWSDQEELSWDDLGIEPELTTVTKLPRRIFSYSKAQITHACSLVRPDVAFLNFAQYVDYRDLEFICDHLNTLGVNVTYTGWGPDVSDITYHVNGGA